MTSNNFTRMERFVEENNISGIQLLSILSNFHGARLLDDENIWEFLEDEGFYVPTK